MMLFPRKHGGFNLKSNYILTDEDILNFGIVNLFEYYFLCLVTNFRYVQTF